MGTEKETGEQMNTHNRERGREGGGGGGDRERERERERERLVIGVQRPANWYGYLKVTHT